MIPPNAGERIRATRLRLGIVAVLFCQRVSRRLQASGQQGWFTQADRKDVEKGRRPPTDPEWRAICAVMPEVQNG